MCLLNRCNIKLIVLVFTFLILSEIGLITSSFGQIIDLNVGVPFCLKNNCKVDNNGQNEIWSVGGNGTLVINYTKERLEKRISSETLNSIFFISEKTILVAGDNGELLFSTNRGETWDKSFLETKDDLQSIFCLNLKECWIIGKSGNLAKGNIESGWVVNKIVEVKGLKDIHFINSDLGFVVGWNNIILKTLNGGKSWKKIGFNYKTNVNQFKSGNFNLERVSFSNNRIGCIAGWGIGEGILLCTKNGGNRWKANILSSQHFIGIVWKDNTVVYAIDEYGENYVSIDTGITGNY